MKQSIKPSLPRVLAAALVALAITTVQAEDKTVVASGHPDYPPFTWRSGQKIVGASAEVTKMIFEKLNVPCEVKYAGNWTEVMDKLEKGDIDVVVSAYMNMERFSNLQYSISFASEPVSVLVKKNVKLPLLSSEDLVGKKGVIVKGESYGAVLDKEIKRELRCVPKSVEDAFKLIIAGKADYMIAGKYQAMNLLAKHGLEDEIKILPNPISIQNSYLAISNQSPYAKNLHEINARLRELIDSGAVEELLKTWEQKWRESQAEAKD